jgi:hypothetical protein
MARRGRPRSGGEYDTDGANLSARLTVTTRRQLDAAAQESGQSLSKELESRLAYTFEMDDVFGNARTRTLLQLIAELVKRAQAETRRDWLKDRFTYDLAVEMIGLAFGESWRLWRPAGSGAPPATFPSFGSVVPGVGQAMRAAIKKDRAKALRQLASETVEHLFGRLRYAPESPAELARDEERLYQALADGLGIKRVSETEVLAKRRSES